MSIANLHWISRLSIYKRRNFLALFFQVVFEGDDSERLHQSFTQLAQRSQPHPLISAATAAASNGFNSGGGVTSSNCSSPPLIGHHLAAGAPPPPSQPIPASPFKMSQLYTPVGSPMRQPTMNTTTIQKQVRSTAVVWKLLWVRYKCSCCNQPRLTKCFFFDKWLKIQMLPS